MPEVTVTVSQPYHVEGYFGGRYGTSMYPRRDYTAEVFGHKLVKTSKADIVARVRVLAYQATGSNRVKFIFQEA